MARIAGVDLPRNKRIEIALTYIYGIGLSRSKEILEKTNIDADIKCQDLNDQQVVSIREILESNYQIEGDLKRFESMSIKRLMEISTYRGRRHRLGLPLRGQRTRTNARTRRGGKKTVAGKKKAPRK
uniref:Small ribosomal subunit protein uS13c n=2 Tax=Pyropia yezoensis TaxID=2788 RepID=RR13_PYRYE|nr:ribosomal protein S13 [Neopyropia yezoensis]Q1XDJ3.1 RecName: Full=Small ribosomal subunit protein uS13c; AltName: Full=30S ribosomal protein S13-2, chloroplastic [Neopyropia yezoensis]AGH27621.1 ribosomal protein S13 [Neopyropia yezoensis]QFZ66957.1 ribosomal protein S13 [Neopyropia yezoensis]ULU28936.1 ribosomal protein S13 [Neopyropia yezoensis]WKD83452.1 ribosomal protein S13 [Neopyropia yezoensis]BAE92418.1 30S ribosomal protein S13 [Neopyropia yezoensis]